MSSSQVLETKGKILYEGKEVYKLFKGTIDVVALSHSNFSFDPNKMSAPYGPSGSGKTTLLKCLGGIWQPTTGNIWFDGADVGSMSKKENMEYRINKIGFIFQDLNLVPALNVYENIELPMLLAGKLSKKERKERIEFLLNKFGILKYKKSFPDELSGGEKQRVAIAVALANDPLVILADEPTANLDEENRRIVLEYLKNLVKEDGKSVLIATHDDTVRKYADIVMRLDKGKVLEIVQG